MAQFKKMKMRINNPDHSKAVQEWLFEQGYSWEGYTFPTQVNNLGSNFLFTGTFNEGQLGWSDSKTYFEDDSSAEVSVQHLDPHLFFQNVSPCNPSIRTYRKKPSPKSEFEKLSQQLKHLDKAIDSHENKQNKRKKDRERVIHKMESMLPEGYGICLTGGVSEYHESLEEVWANSLGEDSVWEWEGSGGENCNLTEGKHYKVLGFDEDGDPIFEDDNGWTDVWEEEDFLASFKRVA